MTKQPPAAPPVYRPNPAPGPAQPKTVAAHRQPHQPAPPAPPVRRPQPTQHVSPTKSAQGTPGQAHALFNRTAPIASQPPRSQLKPAALPPQSANAAQAKLLKTRLPPPASPTSSTIQRTAAAGPRRSGIIQAAKYYPNLHPGAAVPVERSNIFTLDNFADQYRLRKLNSHSVNVPNMKYNFVRTREGQMLLHNRYRHPSLADGSQVLYAGEVFFNNGRLQWWSNGSGHYQPDADGAEQANLPMDQFYSYQQVIKGEHLRKRA